MYIGSHNITDFLFSSHRRFSLVVSVLQVMIQGPTSFHLVALLSPTRDFQGDLKLKEKRRLEKAHLLRNYLGLENTLINN